MKSYLHHKRFSAVIIADRVGRESIDITHRYAHMFPSTQQKVTEKLGESFVNYDTYIEKQRVL